MKHFKRILCAVLTLALLVCLLPAGALADGADYTQALAAVQRYVKAQTPDPIVGSTKGEWAVFALNRGDGADAAWNAKYLENLKTYVDNCDGVLHKRKYTEYSRVTIALSSMGIDATAFDTGTKVYDLVSPLMDRQTNGKTWAEWQGNNGTAFALLALNANDYLDNAEGNATRAALIASLKTNRLASGAWSISGTAPDLDVTAAVVYALAPYYLDSAKYAALGCSVTYAELTEMVDGALAYLASMQDSSGGLGSVEADCWAVIALATLGRDAASDAQFVKSGGSLLEDMLRYYDAATGGFRHLMSGSVDQMASEQAAYGLVAYDRYLTGRSTLYDMRDAFTAPPSITAQPGDVTTAAGTKAHFTVTASGEGLKYQWQYSPDGGASWADTGFTGNKTAKLTVTATAARDGYQYRCGITDAYGRRVISDAAALHVETLRITAQPEDVTAAAGTKAYFTVTAAGEGLKYQWQYSPDGGASWANTSFTGNKTAKLTVTATAARDGYQYRCVITDKYGSQITSGAAALHIR